MTHSILDLYKDSANFEPLNQLINQGAQELPGGISPDYLEKDIWVTELLRLLFDENLLQLNNVAFKGGTALSKCWDTIHRFSEDIDLSIHWADLANAPDEQNEWTKTTLNRSQKDKFRKEQSARLLDWATAFTERLNRHLTGYGIKGFFATLDPRSNGEKIEVHYPSVMSESKMYGLDHVLLEFGGRNRGKPTSPVEVTSNLSEAPSFSTFDLPIANVAAYAPDYILWEKLTALHQFCTQTRSLHAHRLSRHWYDVYQILTKSLSSPFTSETAMNDVIEMKANRWPEKGVDFEVAGKGHLNLVPTQTDRVDELHKDFRESVKSGMYLHDPGDFRGILKYLKTIEDKINAQ